MKLSRPRKSRGAVSLNVFTFIALCTSCAAMRVVDRYSVRWSTPANAETPNYIQLNQPSPPSGAFVGNGDVSLLYAGNGTNYQKKHTAASMDWQQWLYISKNDMVRAYSSSVCRYFSDVI